MQGDDLIPQQVIPGLQPRRHRRRPAAVVRDHLAHAPGARRQGAVDEPGLVDLEPRVARRDAARAGVVDGRHPRDDGPECVGPRVVPVRRDLGPGGDGRRLGAHGPVVVARHGGEGRVQDRVVCVPLALGAGLACGGVIGDEAVMMF